MRRPCGACIERAPRENRPREQGPREHGPREHWAEQHRPPQRERKRTIVRSACNVEQVSEFYSASGQDDLLMKCYLDEQTEIGLFVTSKVQMLVGVKDTFTLIMFKAFSYAAAANYTPVASVAMVADQTAAIPIATPALSKFLAGRTAINGVCRIPT